LAASKEAQGEMSGPYIFWVNYRPAGTAGYLAGHRASILR
jgi:hypothetical protein